MLDSLDNDKISLVFFIVFFSCFSVGLVALTIKLVMLLFWG